MKQIVSEQELLSYVLDAMVEGVAVVDADTRIRYLNPSVRTFVKGADTTDSAIGMKFYDYLGLSSNFPRPTALEKCLRTGNPQYGVQRTFENGRTLRLNIIPVIRDGVKQGAVITSQDITDLVAMEEELDLAFSLTLPNSKVEHKMKCTVEYLDEYDPHTHTIRITGVIQDGLYRHVVNSLKILASLATQDITKVIGIEKDQLVQAIIFHDLGKAQPDLAVGDVVDPKEAFEDGKLHAYRGAELAKHYYDQHDDVVEIIRYHHHSEKELPDTFPWRLLPMLRLFQLIDGLSAALTRGNVKADFRVSDCTVYVTEHNRRPQYNGSWRVNLYTGERLRIE